MNPSAEQTKGILRTVVPTILAYAAGRGWIPYEIVGDLGAVLVSLGAVCWTILVHTESNAVAVVGAIAQEPGSPVKGVILKPTAIGVALEKDTPPTVVVAGTSAARAIAGAPV